MKRIFAIMAAVSLCFALTVPAFAANYGGYEVPSFDSVVDRETYPFVVVHVGDHDELDLYCSQSYVCYPPGTMSDVMKLAGGYQHYIMTPDGWRLSGSGNSFVFNKYNFREFIYASEPIYDMRGDLFFETPSSSPAPVLGTMAGAYETSDFVLGAMGQVLSLVALVIPVVAGLFGIRKGIAFLISRIRGV